MYTMGEGEGSLLRRDGGAVGLAGNDISGRGHLLG
jgi:hypothetical protein